MKAGLTVETQTVQYWFKQARDVFFVQKSSKKYNNIIKTLYALYNNKNKILQKRTILCKINRLKLCLNHVNGNIHSCNQS